MSVTYDDTPREDGEFDALAEALSNYRRPPRASYPERMPWRFDSIREWNRRLDKVAASNAPVEVIDHDLVTDVDGLPLAVLTRRSEAFLAEPVRPI